MGRQYGARIEIKNEQLYNWIKQCIVKNPRYNSWTKEMLEDEPIYNQYLFDLAKFFGLRKTLIYSEGDKKLSDEEISELNKIANWKGDCRCVCGYIYNFSKKRKSFACSYN